MTLSNARYMNNSKNVDGIRPLFLIVIHLMEFEVSNKIRSVHI